VRAISPPFKRPETRTLHTQRAAAHRAHHSALHRAAEHHALLDLLRNAVCNQLCIQLGLLISAMFKRTSLTVMPSSRAVSWRSFSMSSPFLPITMPGRAVWIVMLTFFAARSMWHAAHRSLRQAGSAESRAL